MKLKKIMITKNLVLCWNQKFFNFIFFYKNNFRQKIVLFLSKRRETKKETNLKTKLEIKDENYEELMNDNKMKKKMKKKEELNKRM